MRHTRFLNTIIILFVLALVAACQDQPTAPIDLSERQPAGVPVLSDEGSG